MCWGQFVSHASTSMMMARSGFPPLGVASSASSMSTAHPMACSMRAYVRYPSSRLLNARVRAFIDLLVATTDWRFTHP